MYAYMNFILSKKTKGVQMSLSEKCWGRVALNQSMLFVYGLPRRLKSGMSVYINLQFSEKGKGYDRS